MNPIKEYNRFKMTWDSSVLAIVIDTLMVLLILLLIAANFLNRKRIRTDAETSEDVEHSEAALVSNQAAIQSLNKMDFESEQALFDAVLTVVAKRLDCKRVSLWLYNDERSAIHCRCLITDGQIQDSSISMTRQDYPVYFQALEVDRLIIANDALTDPRTSEFSDNYLVSYGISSMVDYPIQIKGEVIGIICCEHVGTPRQWTLYELEFVFAAAEVCALNLETLSKQHLQEMIDVIYSGTAELIGEAYFQQLVRYLGEVNECSHAFIGKLIEGENIQVLAAWSRDGTVENFTYSLENTPCDNVFKQTTVIVDKDVQTLYPEDQQFKESGTVAYAGTVLKDLQGNAIGLLAVLNDRELTDTANLKKLIEILASRSGSELSRHIINEEKQILEKAIKASSSAVFITDANGIIEYVNPRFSENTGYAADEVIGKHIDIIRSSEFLEQTATDVMASIQQHGEWRGDIRSQAKDGRMYWERCSISSVRDQENTITHLVGVQDDITREYEMTERISYQATHDALTTLINRFELERRVERLLVTLKQQPGEHALCFIDLDQFKIINDTCGHAAGDELLKQISHRLNEIVRKRDTLARLGGDEFAVLIEHCSLDHAYRVVTNLQKEIQEYQFIWNDRSFRIGASMGLVKITEAHASFSEIFKQADAACYMAKEMGRNRIHVYHPEDEDLSRREGEMEWVTRIYKALEEQRFMLVAQAIYSFKESRVTKYEVLIRMNSDDKVLSPGGFLPAAERYNLITKLDRWVIENAIKTLSAHPEFLQQVDFLSINLSGQSLTEESMLEFIMQTFRDNKQVPPDKICFEITETSAIQHLSKATQFISHLRQLGCHFALDDFGSGLSSFGYLKTLKVDFLKIDGMFIRDIATDPIDHAMVKSINEIGHVMGMQTVAEFVENDEIKGMLRGIGIDHGQGYAIGKPIDFEALVNDSNDAISPGVAKLNT